MNFTIVRFWLAYQTFQLYQYYGTIKWAPDKGLDILYELGRWLDPIKVEFGSFPPSFVEVMRDKLQMDFEEFYQKLDEASVDLEREKLGLPPKGD